MGLAPIKLSAVNYAPRPLLHDLHRGTFDGHRLS